MIIDRGIEMHKELSSDEKNLSKFRSTHILERGRATPLWFPVETSTDKSTHKDESITPEKPKQPPLHLHPHNDVFFKTYCKPDTTTHRSLLKKGPLSQLVRRIFPKKIVAFFERLYPDSRILENKMIQVSEDLSNFACAAIPPSQSLPMLYKEMIKTACYPKNTFDLKEPVIDLSSADACKRYIGDLPVPHRMALCTSNLCDIIPPPGRNRAYEEGITQIEQICTDFPPVATHQPADSRNLVNLSWPINMCQPIDPSHWPRVSSKSMEIETSCFDPVTFAHHYINVSHRDSGFNRGKNRKIQCQSAVATHLEREGLGLCHHPKKEIPPPPSSHNIRYATGNVAVKTVCKTILNKHRKTVMATMLNQTEEQTAKDIDKTMQKIKIFNKLRGLPSENHEIAINPSNKESNLLFHVVSNNTLRSISRSKQGELNIRTTNTIIIPHSQTVAIASATFVIGLGIGMGIGFWTKLKKLCSKGTPGTYQAKRVAATEPLMRSR